MTIPAGFEEIDEPGIPAGFSLVPEGFEEIEEGSTLGAIGETALSVGTGSLAAIPAGLAGLGESFINGADAGAERVKKIQDSLTYEPKSAKAKRYNENTQELLNKPVEWLGAGGEFVGGNEGRLAGEILGNFALDLLPFGAAGAALKKGKAKPASEKINKLDKLETTKGVPEGFEEVSQGELDLFSPDQKQLGVSPYDAVGGRWAVDENGIPVKQELSQELSRTQDAEQARLFDDPVFQEPATKKFVESNAAWEERTRQEHVADLVEQLKQKFTPPKGERGSIDLGENLKGYDVEVEPLTLRDGSSLMVRLKNSEGKLAGFVDFAIREDGVLTAENAQVAPGLRGNGAAAQMYKAARDAGYDIAPGKVQTTLGSKMVESLQRKGLINKEAIGERFKAGDLNLVPIDGETLPGQRLPRGQRGAIDTDLVKGTIDAFKRGLATGRDVLDSFKGAFEKPEMDAANAALKNPKSRATIVMMTPDEFHSLAHARTPYEMKWHFAEQSRKDVKEGLASKGGLWDIPYLRINDSGQVQAHEGRHRMDVFKEQGIEMVPVRIQTNTLTWGDTPVWPEKLTSQDFKTTVNLPTPLTPRMNIPRSQRGGIDTKAIGEAIQKFSERMDSQPIKQGSDTPSVDHAVERLPGNRGILDSYIPKDPTPESIIEAALNEEDSSLTMRGVQSGATLTGIKYKSSVIQGVGSLYQNATKRAEKNIREVVKPTEKTVMRLSKTELVELGELMKREMFDDKVYTREQLNDAGFSVKQMDAYTEMREMFNETHRVQNEALVAMGKKPLTKKDAYLSSRWQGAWRTPVYDKTGKLVFYIAETSKKGAEKALNYLKDNGADIDASKSKIEYKKRTQNERSDLVDAYQTMLSIIDSKDPRVEAVKSIYEQGKQREAFVALGQSKHFEAKAGVKGFIGDRPWVKEGTDITEMFQQQFQYAKNAFSWAELSKATDSAKHILSDETLQTAQPNNLSYARQYAKNKLGYGEHQGVAAIESSLAEFFGKDVQTARDALGGWKSWFILSKLGFSPGYVISNFVQPLWTSSWHANLSSQGFKHNPFKTLTFAGADSLGGILKHYFNQDVPMSPIGKDALKYAEDNGIVSRDITDENAGLGANPIKQAGDVIGKATIGTIEHVARLNAFMSFVHHLDQSGKYSEPMKLFEKAEELVNASMVDYRPGERPMVFDQAGLIGSAAANLQTFKFNYYNQLQHFFTEAKEGRPRALAAFIATQGLVGGALSMPFLQEMDDMWEAFKKIAPDALHLTIKDFGIKQEIVKHSSDLFAFGGVSKLTGADMSSRFDSGNLADISLDGLFPFIADTMKQGKAALGAITNPTATTGAQAAYTMAPPGPLQGAVETGMDSFKSGTTASGKTMYKNPNKLEQHDADYARTPGQEMYRKFGLRELEESKYRQQRGRQFRNEAESQVRLKEQSTKFIDAMIRKDKDDMKKYASRFVAYGGEPSTLDETIERESIKAKVPKEILDAAKASSLAAAQKTKKMKELLNGFNK